MVKVFLEMSVKLDDYYLLRFILQGFICKEGYDHMPKGYYLRGNLIQLATSRKYQYVKFLNIIPKSRV